MDAGFLLHGIEGGSFMDKRFWWLSVEFGCSELFTIRSKNIQTFSFLSYVIETRFN